MRKVWPAWMHRTADFIIGYLFMIGPHSKFTGNEIETLIAVGRPRSGACVHLDEAKVSLGLHLRFRTVELESFITGVRKNLMYYRIWTKKKPFLNDSPETPGR